MIDKIDKINKSVEKINKSAEKINKSAEKIDKKSQNAAKSNSKIKSEPDMNPASVEPKEGKET